MERASATDSIHVLLVDDENFVRQALQEYLSLDRGIVCVGACSNGSEVVKFIERNNVEIVLMDLQMPALDGIATTREIRKRHPHVKVLVVTTFDDDGAAEAAIQAGAAGFLLKNTSPAGLIDAIRACHQGLRVIASPTFQRWATNSKSPSIETFPVLRPREREVLALICQGWSNAEIAECLEVTESMVRHVIEKLMHILDAPTRLKVAVRGYELGLDRGA